MWYNLYYSWNFSPSSSTLESLQVGTLRSRPPPASSSFSIFTIWLWRHFRAWRAGMCDQFGLWRARWSRGGGGFSELPYKIVGDKRPRRCATCPSAARGRPETHPLTSLRTEEIWWTFLPDGYSRGSSHRFLCRCTGHMARWSDCWYNSSAPTHFLPRLAIFRLSPSTFC